ncbi:MAG: AsmA-like C-terminal region-containing protein [Opitutaceae bacterium]|nr:AsmA-like C-terminal region-containing protein [Opitutaceae bacterium]
MKSTGPTNRFAQLCWLGVRAVGSCLGSFALWTVWLALVLLLAAQLYVLTAREVAVPGFVLRSLEDRLARGGLRAKFGRTAFDLSGRLFAENVALSLPPFAEPLVTAHALFVRLDPLLLAIGMVEPLELRLNGVAVAVPAMLSPTGRAEALLSDFDLTLEPERNAVVVRQFSGRLAGLTLTAHGKLALGGFTAAQPPGDDLATTIGKKLPQWSRQALSLAEAIGRCEAPSLDLEFSPSPGGSAAIRLRALARVARLPGPDTVEARDLEIGTRIVLFGDAPPSHIDASASELRLPGGVSARGVQARILGRLRLDDAGFDLRELLLTADAVTAAGASATALSARVLPRPLPAVAVSATARILGAPLAVQAEGDTETRRGTARFAGEISPGVLDLIATRLGADVRRFFDFDTMAIERGEVRFGPGGKFERLTARISVPTVRAYGVTMTDGRVLAELEPGRFYAPEAFARIGENFARGSYEHNLATHAHRFLLTGRLRPLAISGWFRSGWWERFFQQFDFAHAAPEADVDVRGVWLEGWQSRVFVFADVAQPMIRGAELDRVRTRLFIRPGFIDSLELLATRGAGRTTGRFTYTADTAAAEWRTVDIAFDSTFELPAIARLIGPPISEYFQPFQLAQAPTARVEGRFAHPAAAGGAATKLRIEAQSAGEFRFYGFPLEDVSFKAAVDADQLNVDHVRALFAGGRVTGQARAWGAGEQRRLAFDLMLSDASLGPLVTGVNTFFAARRGVPPAAPGKFVQDKAGVHVDLAAKAEGGYNDALSYRGEGTGVLRGASLGEVPMLGALSGLFTFTALRFNEARGNFKIEGARIVFPKVTLRGANSAIDGHGTYALDRGELDFNAKIFPFQESGNVIKSVVGAVLTPLSNAFEVRLTGPLDKPEWSLANFSRPAQPGDDPPPAAPPLPAPPPAGLKP